MSVKKPTRWDKPSRWDKDYYPARQEMLSNSGRKDSTEVQNLRLSADDRSQPRENALPKDAPSGLIFMCSSLTKRDCFRFKVFGLPLARRDLVERVVPGTLLFLFDFDVRELYGIYEAVSHGGMNLEPKAFQDFEGSYPAQVRFDTYRECLPLSEDIFKDALKENYYARNKFNFDLTPQQVSKLIQLFCPIEPPRKRIDSRSIMSRMLADHPRQGLVENNDHVPDPIELSYKGSQYTLASEALKMEGIQGYPLPGLQSQDRDGYASLLSHSHRYEHALMDPTFLPRKHPYEHNLIDPLASRGLERFEHLPGSIDADEKGLLDKGHMEEVDQLALRYLQQANPGVGDIGPLSVDCYGRKSLAPQIEHVARHGLAPLSQQDLVHLRAAVGAERLAEIEYMDRVLRNQDSNLRTSQFISGPNIPEKNSVATWSPAVSVGRHISASDSLRQQPVGHVAIRRRS